MKIVHVAAVAILALVAPQLARAQTNERQHLGTPSSPISDLVIVPPGYETIYVSGMRCSGRNEPKIGDTKTQTIKTLALMKTMLEQHGFSMGDVVMLRV